MTIEAWTLLFSAITSGLVLGGGFWLRHVVNQQLKAKDTTIETLNAAIKLRETEIAVLKGDRAPAIAAEYKVMREYADRMTEEKRALEERVNKLQESRKKQDEWAPVGRKLSEMDGLLRSASFLIELQNNSVKFSEDIQEVLVGEVGIATERILGEAASRRDEIYELLG